MNINKTEKYLVSPKPPIVRDELAHIGAGLRFTQSPTKFFNDLREEYGDVFLVDVFGYKLFCVFSPDGLKSLYAAAENEASFGMATFDMLGFKTPVEVFLDADIDLFYELLTPAKVSGYNAVFLQGITEVIDDWGKEGEIDVFDSLRTLEQRVGFRLWIGAEASADSLWPTLKRHFDVLSQENAFVSPQNTLDTLTSGKAKEKAAISHVMTLVGDIIDERNSTDNWPDDTLTFLCKRFAGNDARVTLRKVTHNLINANQGFLSNLYAALAWVLINLQQHPDSLARMRDEIESTETKFGPGFLQAQQALDSMTFCEQLLMESVRLAQRSITLRKVMKEISFDCGDKQYVLQPGVYVTTMLSVINTQTEELARFDPDHYKGRRISPELIAKGKETISTFGHGQHACPAQKFSHNMCKILITLLLQRFEFSTPDQAIAPSSSQMGGVSRAADNVTLRYRSL
ncbi:MAG: cytochrome P450 [Halioglobus sp.]|jgi:cytochrome P450